MGGGRPPPGAEEAAENGAVLAERYIDEPMNNHRMKNEQSVTFSLAWFRPLPEAQGCDIMLKVNQPKGRVYRKDFPLMMKSNRFLALLLALIMALSLGALPALAMDPATDAPLSTESPAAIDEPVSTEPPADGGEADDGEAAPTEEPAAAEPNPEDVVATVNGADVHWSDASAIYANLLTTYSQYGYDVNNAALQAQFQQLAVQYAVQLAVMDQKAAELGLDQLTDEEKEEVAQKAKTDWDSLIDMYASYMGGITAESSEEEKQKAREDMTALMLEQGYTQESVVEEYTKSLIQEKLMNYIYKDATVSAEEIQSAYDTHVTQDQASYENSYANYEMAEYYGQAAWYIPSGIRGITHILLSVDDELLNNYQSLLARWEEQLDAEEKAAEGDGAEPTAEPTAEPSADPSADPTAPAADGASPEPTLEPVTQQQIEDAKAAILASVQDKIDEITKKLDEGAAFADLVAEYSQDPGMKQEPYMSEGYGIHLDSQLYDPAFVAAAFNDLEKVGDVSVPVVGQSGVHILYYNRDVPSGPVALTDDNKAVLEDEVMNNKQEELFQTTMGAWMEAAVITYPAAEAE